jgi:hypothetical protein
MYSILIGLWFSISTLKIYESTFVGIYRFMVRYFCLKKYKIMSWKEFKNLKKFLLDFIFQ